MTYVITAPCIDIKDGTCQDVCPVDCIYEGGRMMYIQPDECINCGLCLSVCPVDAIYEEDLTPDDALAFKAVNADFFAPAVTGWGAPGGASPQFTTTLDHPLVAAVPHRPVPA